MSGGVREELAAVLHHEGWPVEPDWKPEPETCGTCATTLRLADALLPVVERVVAEARAEALRDGWNGAAAEVEAVLHRLAATLGGVVVTRYETELRAALGRQAGGGE